MLFTTSKPCDTGVAVIELNGRPPLAPGLPCHKFTSTSDLKRVRFFPMKAFLPVSTWPVAKRSQGERSKVGEAFQTLEAKLKAFRVSVCAPVLGFAGITWRRT